MDLPSIEGVIVRGSNVIHPRQKRVHYKKIANMIDFVVSN